MSFWTHLYKSEIGPQESVSTKYELIDSDPIFGKVVRYFRPSDYAIWAAGTAFAPAAFSALEYLNPVNGRRYVKPSGANLRFLAFVGFGGGFLSAYVRSSKRFLGLTENKAEVKKDRYEVKKYLAENRIPYPRSELDPWLQNVAVKNSQNSMYALSFFLWFNFVNHSFHGVDIRKYWEVRSGEEDWGFALPSIEDVANTKNSDIEY